MFSISQKIVNILCLISFVNINISQKKAEHCFFFRLFELQTMFELNFITGSFTIKDLNLN